MAGQLQYMAKSTKDNEYYTPKENAMDWFLERLQQSDPTLDYQDLCNHKDDFKKLVDLQIIKYTEQIETVACDFCDENHSISPFKNNKGEIVLSCSGGRRVLDPDELKVWTINRDVLLENVKSENRVVDKNAFEKTTFASRKDDGTRIVKDGQVQFTKDNEYYTPKEFVSRFGDFDYDPATTKEKAEEFDIKNFDTIETDGLSKDWTQYKRIWINPPFTKKHEFIAKAQWTYQQAKNEIYILFPIEFITTARFHNSVYGGKIFIPNGRINFESGIGKKGKSPAFGSVVMKIQDNWEIEMLTIK